MTVCEVNSPDKGTWGDPMGTHSLTGNINVAIVKKLAIAGFNVCFCVKQGGNQVANFL